MRVWVTRAQPGADATAARLRNLGHEPIVAPVLAVRPLAPAMDLDGVGAVAFTSANGVRAFAALTPSRHWPVYAVGAATADVARDAGFTSVVSADGDLAALSAIIRARRSEWTGALLHPGAVDLAGDLSAPGVEIRAVAVYETVVIPVDAVAAACAEAVMIHSPRAAKAVAKVAGAADLAAVCISAAAAAPLRSAGFARVAAAATPDEAALLSLLDAVP